jgi:hypothetical protein
MGSTAAVKTPPRSSFGRALAKAERAVIVQRAEAATTLDARVQKIAGVSFEAVQCALNVALREKYPDAEGDGPSPSPPRVRDVFDDVVIYSYDGKLYRVAYTFSGNVATLGEPEEVQVTYAPVGTEVAPPAAEPPVTANSKLGREIISKRIDDMIDRFSSRR